VLLQKLATIRPKNMYIYTAPGKTRIRGTPESYRIEENEEEEEE